MTVKQLAVAAERIEGQLAEWVVVVDSPGVLLVTELAELLPDRVIVVQQIVVAAYLAEPGVPRLAVSVLTAD